MSACEMCGYGTLQLHKSIVEGSIMLLCDKCVRFGEVIELKRPADDIVNKRLDFYKTSRFASASVAGKVLPEDDLIVSDYAPKVKRAREKSGKTQEEIALALAEKVSILQKVESGHMAPPMKLARKLEQFFKIELIKKAEKTVENFDTPESAGSFTIGDAIKFKK
ncbi:TIGR00270 family protein [Candidatus Woesearchaeota archaeon]|nr:TIGR00270 family protein [Candidatus Woesearchaeota archaeon]